MKRTQPGRLSYTYVAGKAFHAFLRAFTSPPPELASIPGYLHPLEGMCLHWLAGKVPPGGIAVEVGSFKGKSSAYLASGLKAPGARLACVDVWENRAMPFDPPEDVLPEFERNVARYREKIDIHRGLSTDVAATFPALIDVLFIDGDHSFEGCSADIDAWLPRVRRGGHIAFHDSSQEGVARAIAERLPPSRRSRGVLAWSIFVTQKR